MKEKLFDCIGPFFIFEFSGLFSLCFMFCCLGSEIRFIEMWIIPHSTRRTCSASVLPPYVYARGRFVSLVVPTRRRQLQWQWWGMFFPYLFPKAECIYDFKSPLFLCYRKIRAAQTLVADTPELQDKYQGQSWSESSPSWSSSINVSRFPLWDIGTLPLPSLVTYESHVASLHLTFSICKL